MKKIYPSLFILILIVSLTLFIKSGVTDEKHLGGTCNQVVCPKSGAIGAIIQILDSTNTVVASCTTTTTPCCTITGLTSGQSYTAVYSNSTCANNAVGFTACTGGNLQVPGCP